MANIQPAQAEFATLVTAVTNAGCPSEWATKLVASSQRFNFWATSPTRINNPGAVNRIRQALLYSKYKLLIFLEFLYRREWILTCLNSQ